MSRRRILLGTIGIAAGAGCAGPGPGPGPSSVAASRRTFVELQVGGEFGALAPLIETFDEPLSWRASVFKSYLGYLTTLRNSGQSMLGEDVVDIEMLADGSRRVALLRVSQSWTHPMHASPQTLRTTVFGFSRDDGVTWRFNVLDCINTDDLRRFMPKYNGVPPMHPETHSRSPEASHS